MIFFLKFGASWLLPPGIFILCFALAAIFLWRRHERRFAAIIGGVTLVFYLLCTGFIAERLMGSLERNYDVPTYYQGDCIIMLGGGAIAGVKDVDGIGMLTASPSSRVLAAVRLQKELGVPILLAGGQVFNDTGAEALIAKRVIMSLGVPEDKILVESKSLTTTQNALFSAEILREKGLTKPILVTSAFHMPRAVLNFERSGIDVIPYPTDFWVGKSPEFYYLKLAPQAGALHTNAVVLSEKLRTLVMLYLE